MSHLEADFEKELFTACLRIMHHMATHYVFITLHFQFASNKAYYREKISE